MLDILMKQLMPADFDMNKVSEAAKDIAGKINAINETSIRIEAQNAEILLILKTTKE